MGDDEAGMIGRRVRQVRKSRDKSLRVLAELAGMNRCDRGWTKGS
jgi:transcriptional regulator with XRE-family HTH domain